MRVIISGAVAVAATQSVDLLLLQQLFIYAYNGRHVLAFDPPDCLDAWLASLDEVIRDCYQNAMRQSARQAHLPHDVATILVGFEAQERWADPIAHLSLANALAVLNEPVGILLENKATDWAFLRKIMRQQDRETLDRAIDKRWAEPLHGGGNDLQKNLESRLAKAVQGLRTFVMFDSDRLHPDEWDEDWDQGDCQALVWERIAKANMPLRYWVLRRRFIESYMPRTELEVVASEEMVDAFFRLSQAGRWYYNMKLGFKKDDNRQDSARRKELSKAANENDWNILASGFGKDLATRYSEATNEFAWDAAARAEADEILPRLMRLL